MGKLMIQRAYVDLDNTLGKRILVDRVWPRGRSKETLALDLWAKELAPTKELRKAFNHQAEKFEWFRESYRQELAANPATSGLIQQIQDWLKEQDVYLLYGAKDEVHNQAVVLQEYILENMKEYRDDSLSRREMH